MDEKEIQKLQDDLKAANDKNALLQKDYDGLKTKYEDLEKKGKPSDDEGDDDDLRAKAKKDAEDKKAQQANAAQIEKAIEFTHAVKSLVKESAELLPAAIQGILDASEKENYDSKVQKAAHLKRAIVEEFFSVQSNVDLLTSSQKTALADYLKLTKNGKEERADSIYDTVFEPTLEMLRRLKKKDDVLRSRDGHSATDDSYKARLLQYSNERHGLKKG